MNLRGTVIFETEVNFYFLNIINSSHACKKLQQTIHTPKQCQRPMETATARPRRNARLGKVKQVQCVSRYVSHHKQYSLSLLTLLYFILFFLYSEFSTPPWTLSRTISEYVISYFSYASSLHIS